MGRHSTLGTESLRFAITQKEEEPLTNNDGGRGVGDSIDNVMNNHLTHANDACFTPVIYNQSSKAQRPQES